ncbi:MAG: sulfatase-like hydrolase/transferase [Chitinophagaceae bacterium]
MHEFTRNYYAVPVTDALRLILIYSLVAVILVGCWWLFFRDVIKAGLVTTMLMAMQFFFGVVQDTLIKNTSLFFSAYRFLIPAGLFFIGLTVYLLKKIKSPFNKLSFYLNSLLLLLVAIDSAWLIGKISADKNYVIINSSLNGHSIPDSCLKRDIYFLLMDQYAGNSALKEIYQFDNVEFLDELKKRGFFIAENSRSNYNLTPFSMASVLSMNYLDSDMAVTNKLNLSYCYQAIRNSSVIQFMKREGYTFYNYSVFDFPDQPAHKYESFLPYGADLVTLNTFTGRLKRDIKSSIAEGKFGSASARNKIVYENQGYNDSTFKLTEAIAGAKSSSPKFVYAHFMLPHFPYYYDKKGKPLPIEKLTDFKRTNSVDYIEYLQYANGKILKLIDYIFSKNEQPPIIILLSDHGSRHLKRGEEITNDFVNLNAVYIPGKNYTGFYDSISNVNEFRVLFNNCFAQQLPILKDSTNNIKN